MGRGQAVPEDDAGDEAAGYALAVLDGHVAPFNDALLIGIAGAAFDTSATAEEGYQRLLKEWSVECLLSENIGDPTLM